MTANVTRLHNRGHVARQARNSSGKRNDECFGGMMDVESRKTFFRHSLSSLENLNLL